MQTDRSPESTAHRLADSPMLAWLSDAFNTIEAEGLATVDAYWRDLRLEGKHQPYYPKVTLGLRIRRRPGGSFGLEWFGIGTLGSKRRYIAKRHIPKGKAESYSIKRLMRGQPQWLMPLVEDTEYRLARIRSRHAHLSKMREALAGWYSHALDTPLRGREMLDHYRMLTTFPETHTTKAPLTEPEAAALPAYGLFTPNLAWTSAGQPGVNPPSAQG